MLRECFQSVLRTSGLKSAMHADERASEDPVSSDWQGNEKCHWSHAAFRIRASLAARTFLQAGRQSFGQILNGMCLVSHADGATRLQVQCTASGNHAG